EVNRLLALKGERIELVDLSSEVARRRAALTERAAPAGPAAVTTLRDGERRTILAALIATRGNKARAAEVLAIARGSLWHKMREHRITDEEVLRAVSSLGPST